MTAETHERQYRIEISENGKIIDEQVIDDPFVVTTIGTKGLKAAWHVLRHGCEFVVRISGTHAAYRVVFTGDYEPPDESALTSTQEPTA